ncbi:hypothetical protein L1857_00685 [Amycolatopsis thermalba]|uniref:Uncharacterized protein n=1 Tax=Amycolatopsis thermalba TaxID=944492 RepID=A0ABY4NMB5_9PSEU|nr:MULTISPECIES: hypothetical protein [Amycolatopsis]UQS21446.1 hypothetical protein L1857_00685 [Amycolatopsis thermalba]
MGKLTNRARAKADYFWFIGSREWPVFVSALGVLLGLVTLVPSAVGIVLSGVALALGVLTLTRDIRMLRGRWAAYEFAAIAAPFPHADVPPPASYPEARYLHLTGRGTALVSDAIDRALWTQRFSVEVAPDPYRLPAELKATAPYVLPLRAHGRLLFNGKVVGMRVSRCRRSGTARRSGCSAPGSSTRSAPTSWRPCGSRAGTPTRSSTCDDT